MNNNSGKSAFAAVALVGKKKPQAGNQPKATPNAPTATTQKTNAPVPPKAQEIIAKVTQPQNALVQDNAALANEVNNHAVVSDVAKAETAKPTATNTIKTAEKVQEKQVATIVSEVIETSQKAAKDIKKLQEETNQAIQTMFQKTANEHSVHSLVNPIEFMTASFERFQNRVSEMNENIQESREANRQAITQIVDATREAMDDISAACIEATQKSVTSGCPMTTINNQIECAQKIQSACSSVLENASKSSYQAWRNYMSMWFFVK